MRALPSWPTQGTVWLRPNSNASECARSDSTSRSLSYQIRWARSASAPVKPFTNRRSEIEYDNKAGDIHIQSFDAGKVFAGLVGDERYRRVAVGVPAAKSEPRLHRIKRQEQINQLLKVGIAVIVVAQEWVGRDLAFGSRADHAAAGFGLVAGHVALSAHGHHGTNRRVDTN